MFCTLGRSILSKELCVGMKRTPSIMKPMVMYSHIPVKEPFIKQIVNSKALPSSSYRYYQLYSRLYQQSVRSIVSKSSENPPIPLRTFALFSLSVVGIISAYMAVSWVLTSTNAYKDGMEILKNCPKVYDYTGFPFNRVGRVKGRTKNGEVLMTVKLQGDKGVVLVTIYGKEVEKNKYELIDMHVEPVVSSKITSTTTKNTTTTDKDANELKEDQTFVIIQDKICQQQLFKKFSNLSYTPEVETLMKDCPINEEIIKEKTTKVSTIENENIVSEVHEPEKPKSNNSIVNYWLDKPWYYKIFFAIGLGLVGGILLGMGMFNMKLRPGHSSAFQAAFKILKNDKKVQEILGNRIKAVGTIKGKAEDTWANFSIKVKGSNAEAMANVQGIREANEWKFTILSLDTKQGKYYIKK